MRMPALYWLLIVFSLVVAVASARAETRGGNKLTSADCFKEKF